MYFKQVDVYICILSDLTKGKSEDYIVWHEKIWCYNSCQLIQF